MVEFFIFDSVPLLFDFIFFLNKNNGLLDNKKKQTHRHFHSNTSDFFKLQQEFLKFDDICESRSSPKTDMETNFLHLQNPNFENFSFCQ